LLVFLQHPAGEPQLAKQHRETETVMIAPPLTWSGFIYLAMILDAWSRRVVGWSMGEQMSSDLVLGALNMALQQRRPE
jgi:transposase InsO family protein